LPLRGLSETRFFSAAIKQAAGPQHEKPSSNQRADLGRCTLPQLTISSLAQNNIAGDQSAPST